MGLRVVALQTHPSVVGRIRLWTHPKPPIAARHAPAPPLERERNSGLFLPPPWRSLPLVDWIKLIQRTMLSNVEDRHRGRRGPSPTWARALIETFAQSTCLKVLEGGKEPVCTWPYNAFGAIFIFVHRSHLPWPHPSLGSIANTIYPCEGSCELAKGSHAQSPALRKEPSATKKNGFVPIVEACSYRRQSWQGGSLSAPKHLRFAVVVVETRATRSHGGEEASQGGAQGISIRHRYLKEDSSRSRG